MSTGDLPLLYCDTDMYWGTGRLLDSDQWDKSNEIPGRNVIGTILSNVRNRLRPAGGARLSINASPVAVAAKKMDKYESDAPSARELAAEIAPTVIPAREKPYQDKEEKDSDELNLDFSKDSIDSGGTMLKMLHRTMGTKPSKPNTTSLDERPAELIKSKEKNEDDNKTDVSENTELTEGNENGRFKDDLVKSLDRGPTESTKNSEKSVNDSKTDVSGSMGLSEGNENGGSEDDLEKASDSSSILMDLNESSTATIDSISVRSDHTIDIANLTLSDGKLDKEKVTNLPFPQVNISRSLEKSFMDLQNKSRASIKTTENRGKEEQTQPSHCSTPVSTVTSRKQPRRSK